MLKKIICLGLLLGAPVLFAAEELEKIGGTFTVEKIEQKPQGGFIVEFKAEPAGQGAVDTVVLESDHIHVGVKKGDVLRLSAEVAEKQGRKVIASQIVLFLPSGAPGPTPVWLLSQRALQKGIGRPPGRYLEMHDPKSDYTVF